MFRNTRVAIQELSSIRTLDTCPFWQHFTMPVWSHATAGSLAEVLGTGHTGAVGVSRMWSHPRDHRGTEQSRVIEQPNVIAAILKHLDLWQLPPLAPPPRLFPQKLESILASLSPQQAQVARAPSDALFWDEVPTWED